MKSYPSLASSAKQPAGACRGSTQSTYRGFRNSANPSIPHSETNVWERMSMSHIGNKSYPSTYSVSGAFLSQRRHGKQRMYLSLLLYLFLLSNKKTYCCTNIESNGIPVELSGTNFGCRWTGPNKCISVCLYIAIAVQNSPVTHPNSCPEGSGVSYVEAKCSRSWSQHVTFRQYQGKECMDMNRYISRVAYVLGD